MWAKENLCMSQEDIQNTLAITQAVWRFLRKLKINQPHDPTMPGLDINPEEVKAVIRKYLQSRVVA